MNILDNELVLKYFAHNLDNEIDGVVSRALRVLQAMQEPIRKGEEYLYIYPSNGKVDEDIWDKQMPVSESKDWHPHRLRLPDKFQKRACECICYPTRGEHPPEASCACSPQPQRDEVEEKIKAISKNIYLRLDPVLGGYIVSELRELVRLARKREKHNG